MKSPQHIQDYLKQLEEVVKDKNITMDVQGCFTTNSYMYDYLSTVKVKYNRWDYAICMTEQTLDSILLYEKTQSI